MIELKLTAITDISVLHRNLKVDCWIPFYAPHDKRAGGHELACQLRITASIVETGYVCLDLIPNLLKKALSASSYQLRLSKFALSLSVVILHVVAHPIF